MALDTLIDRQREETGRRAIADAIRAKGGTAEPLAFPEGFASAVDAIEAALPTQEKTVTITENGETAITPDVGKLLSKVIAQVNVAGGGGIDPAPFKAIEVLHWTPASDTDRNVFQTSINPMACFFTAVPGFDDEDTVGGVGCGFALAVDKAFVNPKDHFAGVVMPINRSSSFDGRTAIMRADASGKKEFELQTPYGGLKFKAGREYIVTVFEI